MRFVAGSKTFIVAILTHTLNESLFQQQKCNFIRKHCLWVFGGHLESTLRGMWMNFSRKRKILTNHCNIYKSTQF